MKNIPNGKYVAYQKIDLPDREWVNRSIENAPIWCSVDLRDGNQALVNPMDLDKKLRLFNLLVQIGFKNIEVGFPSASKTEFQFLRTLVERDLIPDGVTVQVLVQAREHLIKRSFEALKGVKKAVVHLYNSTSVAQRKIVFRKEKREVIELALHGVDLIKEEAKNFEGEITLEYSPESFTGTELEFAKDICNEVVERWEASPERKVIINLPATVEMATPNIYADQIEWMGKNLKNRESIILSIHAHNDRGTAVAATELALMAGADRVEGTLLGNGERTGNVDIVTLALNMTTQGVDSTLNFSDLEKMVEVVEDVTEIKTGVRHPYVGELVYTAFSGSHQDAIHKGFAYQSSKDEPLWEVPYLPIDPNDVGRTYEDIIRINSQSGKGGVAYILEKGFDYQLPKAMHPEVGRLIQKRSDVEERELSTNEIFAEFEREYLNGGELFEFINFKRTQLESEEVICELEFTIKGEKHSSSGVGNGILDSVNKAIGKIFPEKFEIVSFSEHSKGSGSDATAVAYIQIENDSFDRFFGVGIDTDTTKASIKALFSSLNRAFEEK
jgi:2-isopropylmalate synthase